MMKSRGVIRVMARFMSGGEQGQLVVLAAFTMVIVLGFAALAIDTGQFLQTRTKLQADVDAMSLSAAQALCGTPDCDADAAVIAGEIQVLNGLTESDTVSIAHTTNNGKDCDGNDITNHSRITSRATRHDNALLAQVIASFVDSDFDGTDITACATAGKFAFGGSNGIRPFALEDDCIIDLTFNEVVVVKHDADSAEECDSSTGNYSAVSIDGTGASVYRTTIKYGSDGLVCTDTTPGCCPNLNEGCIGVYRIDTEPGNMIGPTRDGVDFLIDNTPEACDSWEEVTSPGEGEILHECEPWNDTYSGVGTRIIIIPIVDGLWDRGGRHAVTIKDFAVLFLEGYSGKCSGKSCDVEARFIKMTETLPNAVLNPSGPLTNITLVTLVE